MKKLLSLVLAMVMLMACAAPALADEGSEPDWTEYDALVAEIKSTTDFVEREALLHKAEDMLMATYAVVPLYYYNDLYLQKSNVDGIYANLFQTKFFAYATKTGDNADTLRVNIASEPDFLDPALNSSVDGACLAALSFSGLYTYDSTGSLVPALAESYEMSEDGLTYTFTLKDDLKWSDGSKLDANDFVYSWKRAANPETAADYAYMLNGIAGYPDNLQVSASEDGKVFTVVLSAPCAYCLLPGSGCLPHLPACAAGLCGSQLHRRQARRLVHRSGLRVQRRLHSDRVEAQRIHDLHQEPQLVRC